MHCFNHQKTSAVCACAICLKGLCNDCMQPSEARFVCSQGCAEYLQKITKLNNCAMEIYGIDKPGAKFGKRTALMYLVLGVAFLGHALYFATQFSDPGFACFGFILGIVFFVFGCKTYKRGLRI